MTDPFAILAELRDGGWRLVEHYDWRDIRGDPHVFREFVNPAGRRVMADRSSDLDALEACAFSANMLNIGIG